MLNQRHKQSKQRKNKCELIGSKKKECETTKGCYFVKSLGCKRDNSVEMDENEQFVEYLEGLPVALREPAIRQRKGKIISLKNELELKYEQLQDEIYFNKRSLRTNPKSFRDFEKKYKSNKMKCKSIDLIESPEEKKTLVLNLLMLVWEGTSKEKSGLDPSNEQIFALYERLDDEFCYNFNVGPKEWVKFISENNDDWLFWANRAENEPWNKQKYDILRRAKIMCREVVQSNRNLVTFDGHGRFIYMFYKCFYFCTNLFDESVGEDGLEVLPKFDMEYEERNLTMVPKINVYTLKESEYYWHMWFFPNSVKNIKMNVFDHVWNEKTDEINCQLINDYVVYLNFCGIDMSYIYLTKLISGFKDYNKIMERERKYRNTQLKLCTGDISMKKDERKAYNNIVSNKYKYQCDFKNPIIYVSYMTGSPEWKSMIHDESNDGFRTCVSLPLMEACKLVSFRFDFETRRIVGTENAFILEEDLLPNAYKKREKQSHKMENDEMHESIKRLKIKYYGNNDKDEVKLYDDIENEDEVKLYDDIENEDEVKIYDDIENEDEVKIYDEDEKVNYNDNFIDNFIDENDRMSISIDEEQSEYSNIHQYTDSNDFTHFFNYEVRDYEKELEYFVESNIVSKPPSDFLNIDFKYDIDEQLWPVEIPNEPKKIPYWSKGVLYVGAEYYFYFININGKGKLSWIAKKYPYFDDDHIYHDINYNDKVYYHKLGAVFGNQKVLDGAFYQDSMLWTLLADSKNAWIVIPKKGNHDDFFRTYKESVHIPRIIKDRIYKIIETSNVKNELDDGLLEIMSDKEPLNAIKPLPYLKKGKLMYQVKMDDSDTVTSESS